MDAWTYVVALASDGAIDEPGAIGVFAESAELRALQEAVGTARRAARSFGALDARERGNRRRLRGTRHRQPGSGQAPAPLQRELHETERWLRQLEGSRSWRITRPIRAAGAAFRRLSQWRAGAR